ncbi:MAG: hypothetical protein QOJ35_1234 [Solirubrobacteraceae bacterium]|jgi:hypothetical protein|nr:hypothetical protein [Solirubrobacteraceae bacterium]
MHALRSACLASVLALLGAGVDTATAAPQRAPAPALRIVEAPPARTSARDARFRFDAARARTWCRLDDHPFRRCRSGVAYSGLRARRHVFVVRAKDGRRSASASRRWSVVATAAAARPAGASGPTQIDGPGAPVPVFSEDFDGPSIDPATWDLYDGPGHAGSGLRRPSAFSLDGQGHLVLTASMQDGTLVSGGMAHRVDYTYGRFVFRVRTEADPTGTMSADVLTWPKVQSPTDYSEIDMYELGWHPDNTSRFSTFVHFGTQASQDWFVHDSDPTQWHVIEMDWTPDRLDIYRDGAYAWGTTDRAVIPHVPHHLCIQLDAIADRTLARPVHMYVDWVRIYR